MINSTTLHCEAVAAATTASAAHVPSIVSAREGGCVCHKCAAARGYLVSHKCHRLADNASGIYCQDCSDWVVFSR